MSGPKAYTVTVVSAAELRRRALEATRARFAEVLAAVDRLEILRRQAADLYGVNVACPAVQTPAGDDPTVWENAASRLRTEVARTKAELASRTATARTQRLLVALDDGRDLPELRPVRAPNHSRDAVGERAGVQSAPPDEKPQERRRRSVARLLGVLAAESGDPPPDLRALGRRVLAADGERAELLLARLRDEADASVHRVRARRERHRLLDEYRASLAGQPGAEVQALRARLDELDRDVDRVDAQVPTDLADEVAAVVARCRAEQDRVFALQALVGALEGLGYEVEPGFDVGQAHAGQLYLRRASWSGYGVRLTSDAGNTRIATRIMRSGVQPPGSRDLEIEQEWCADLAQVRDSPSLGVRMEADWEMPAGVHEVASSDHAWLSTGMEVRMTQPRKRAAPLPDEGPAR